MTPEREKQVLGDCSHRLVASSLDSSCTQGDEIRRSEVVGELKEP